MNVIPGYNAVDYEQACVGFFKQADFELARLSIAIAKHLRANGDTSTAPSPVGPNDHEAAAAEFEKQGNPDLAARCRSRAEQLRAAGNKKE